MIDDWAKLGIPRVLAVRSNYLLSQRMGILVNRERVHFLQTVSAKDATVDLASNP